MARVQQLAFNFTTGGQIAVGWLRPDLYPVPTNISVMVTQDIGASLTLALVYIIDDVTTGESHPVTVSQAVNTVTVVDNGPFLTIGNGLGHGLAVGDGVWIDGPVGQNPLIVATVVSATSYTCTSPVSQTLALQNAIARTGKAITAGAAGDKIIGATGAGITVRTTLAINAPIAAITLLASTVTTPGVGRLVLAQGEQHS